MNIHKIIKRQDWTVKEAKAWIQTCKNLIKITDCEKTKDSLIIVAEHCFKIIKNKGVN